MAEIKPARIFLSYARKDVGIINDLYDKLKQAGFSPWQDVKDILPGEDWQKMLMRAIQEAPFFLACLSKNYVDRRGMIQVEIKEALEMWRQKLDDDIYFIPVRLEECPVPEALAKFQWVDLFEDGGFEKLAKALREGIKKLGLVIRPLRSKPIKNLSRDDVDKMLKELDFFDYQKNWMGRGITHLYEPIEFNEDKVVVDHTTNLIWQQAGSNEVTYDEAQEYINQLNRNKFAGFNDWRLPTLEELMSLMEARKEENDLFINSLFDKEQRWIWTVDNFNTSAVWGVGFDLGFCHYIVTFRYYWVRAVRSGQSLGH